MRKDFKYGFLFYEEGKFKISMVREKRNYETIFIVSVKLGEEKIKEIVDKFKSFISEKAELESVDEWGKKELAYPINYEKEGYYVLLKFKSDSNFSAELDRVYGITDGIIRSLIILEKEKINKKLKR